jgi:hypothetical protein
LNERVDNIETAKEPGNQKQILENMHAKEESLTYLPPAIPDTPQFSFELPPIPDSLDIGVGLALREARRVLRKGGCMMFLIRSQSPDEFFPVFQCSHAPQALQKLLDKAGFQKAKRIPVTLNELGLPGTRFGRGLKHQELWITHTL